jgi:hypothetical protein
MAQDPLAFSYADPPAAGNDPQSQALQFFRNKGLTPEQAAGVVRRLNLESRIGTEAFNPAGGGQGAYGIAQWRGPRQQALLASPDPHSLQGQLNFAWNELQGPESKTLDQLRQTKTAQQAYDVWTSSYERPGPTKEALGWREAAAGPAGGAGAPTTPSGAQRPSGGLLDAFLGSLLAQPEPAKPATPPSLLDQFLDQLKTPESLKTPKSPKTPSGEAATMAPPQPAPLPEQAVPTLAQTAQPPTQGGGFLDHFLSTIAKTARQDVAGIKEIPSAIAELPAEAEKQFEAHKGETLAQRALEPSGLAQATGIALSFGPGAIEKAPEMTPPLPEVRALATKIDDDLNRLQKSNTADKIEMMKLISGLPEQIRSPAFQGKVAQNVERRLIDPKAEYEPDVADFLGQAKGMSDHQTEIANRLRRKLGEADAGAAELPGTHEGYMHRIVTGQGSLFDRRFDPAGGGTGDVVTGGGRTLSKQASGMQPRTDWYVLQAPNGNRMFANKRLADTGYQYGQTIRDSNGRNWTVKMPTMEEIEQNTGIRYHKNWLANTADNVLRLRRIERNVDFLNSIKPELQGRGLWLPRGSKGIQGKIRVDLPQLDGWAEPHIAHVLNDFYNTGGGDLDTFMRKVNRFLIGSLFVTPIPHAGNVLAHWAVGRGWDWLSLPALVRAAKTGSRAMRAVWTLNQDYTRMLREGSGMLRGDVETENFYNVMMKKLFNEQLADEASWTDYARSFGFKAVRDLVRAEYRWSRRTLWAANDMLLLQRQFELEAKGLPTREAIMQAEKDIPNYRIPSEIMGSRPLAEALRNPNIANFGRYKYGQIKSLGSMVTELIGPKATPRERFEAAGKLTVLGVLGTVAYPIMDAALQQKTGNPEAQVRRFGPLAPLDAIYGFSTGQRDYASAIASFLTIAPVAEMGVEALTGNNPETGQPLVDANTTLGRNVQRGEAVASHLYPAQLAMQAMHPGGLAQAGGGLVGLRLPPPGTAQRRAKAQRMQRGRAKSREKRDPVENTLRRVIGDTGPLGGTVIGTQRAQ